MDGCVNGWMIGWLAGCMNGWWVNGCMDLGGGLILVFGQWIYG